MMKAPQQSHTEFEQHPAGSTTLVCTRIIDTGTVWNDAKQREEHKISFFFESSKLMQSGDYAGQPFLVMASFNFSMFRNSHLCKFIEAWRGVNFASQEEADDFDLSQMLGQPLFANIVHNQANGRTYTNINSPMPVPEGMQAPQPQGDLIVFDLSNPDRAMFEKLSDKMKERIKRAKEWQEMGKPQGSQPQERSETSSQNSASQSSTSEAPPVDPEFNDDLSDVPF